MFYILFAIVIHNWVLILSLWITKGQFCCS